jgi:CPA2 family monovalent cation:H+ antiporter-2
MSVDQNQLRGQVVVVGYGRVGRRLGEELKRRKIHFVVAEQNREIVEQLRRQGIPAVAGNAADPIVLVQAHIARAKFLAVATPDTFHVRKMIETARALNPSIVCLVRTDNASEAALLEKESAAKTFLAEQEIALGMTRYIDEFITEEDNTMV